MNKNDLKRVIEISSGIVKADLVVKRSQVVDVYTGIIKQADIAIYKNVIAGIGDYEGHVEINGDGKFAIPGLIESHIHIESSFLTPTEFARQIILHGTTTVIADPHEIVNVCGTRGLKYMTKSADLSPVDIKFQIPSCVPATSFENSGDVLNSRTVKKLLKQNKAFGLGEMMNFPGVINGDQEVLNKIHASFKQGKIIDGHAPGVTGKALNSYIAAGIKTDHECTSIDEMLEKISLGMYIQLREGSAAKELRNLLKGITKQNSRRLLLCSDDRNPIEILETGHLNAHLKICVEEGIDSITAIQMATLNPSECYQLHDRGAIAPGLKADIVLVDDLKEFKTNDVIKDGKWVVKNKIYMGKKMYVDAKNVSNTVKLANFDINKMRLNSQSDIVKVIDIIPKSLLTKSSTATIKRDEHGDFIYDSQQDILKIAVIERHKKTGNVAVGLIRGYGLKTGALAQTIAHDSHNIVVIGTNNEDMKKAVEEIYQMQGGIAVVVDGVLKESMPLPIAGLMTNNSAHWARDRILRIENTLHELLGVHRSIEPIMTLAFMSLPVIPSLKITDKGLFDVDSFSFTDIEVD